MKPRSAVGIVGSQLAMKSVRLLTSDTQTYPGTSGMFVATRNLVDSRDGCRLLERMPQGQE
ncbi:MAG: hypothetical protein C4K47_03690 [Candidatus Thorarchaeota archaeon]|nr:MAG: hypothetical protein C4K47_03690 [Candidatus Thorarchaeota archaeon]